MSDESESLEHYKKAGLDLSEARLVLAWVEEGKPGLAQAKAEQLLTIYLNGYSCQDIQRQFPEYPLPLILWARAVYQWDEAREKYRKNLVEQVSQTALVGVAESLRFMTDLLSATHVKIKKEIMTYLADPDNQPAPSLVPINIREYAVLHNTLRETITPVGKGKEAGVEGIPSLNINIKTAENKRPEVEIEPFDVKEALRRSLEDKTNG